MEVGVPPPHATPPRRGSCQSVASSCSIFGRSLPTRALNMPLVVLLVRLTVLLSSLVRFISSTGRAFILLGSVLLGSSLQPHIPRRLR